MKDYLLLILGYVITAFGVSLTVHVSHVGLEPWVAFIKGLSEKGLSYGIWNAIIQVIFITITWVIEKRKPRIGTFINIIVMSTMIDFFILFNPFSSVPHGLYSYMFYILAIFIASFGMSIAIVSNVGVGAKTQFYVTVHILTSIRIDYVKYALEITGLVLALMIGGPIYVGTFIFLYFSGFFIGKMVPYLQKKMNRELK